MKKLFLIHVTMVFVGNIIAQTPINDPSWGSPTWQDEFDTTALRSYKWYQANDWRNNLKNRGNSTLGTCYNNDLKGYRTTAPNNLSFNSGIITLVTKSETNTFSVADNQQCTTDGNPPWSTESDTRYYSTPAWLMSQKIFKYGYFEIKCRLPDLSGTPNDKGLGANFWMWSTYNGVKTTCHNEIDIFEFIHYNDGDAYEQTGTYNAHYRDCDSIGDAYERSLNPLTNYGSINFSGSFHTFGLAWYPNKLEYYYDDQLVYVSADRYFYDDYGAMPMIVDMNVFTYGWQADANTQLPYNYEVDYVRAYALNTTTCGTPALITTSDFSGFSFNVYQTITVTPAPSLIVSSGQNKTLRASDSIELDPGFEVQSNAVFTADIVGCPTQVISALPH